MHRRLATLLTLALFVLAGCRGASVIGDEDVSYDQGVIPTADAVPEGTVLQTELNDRIDTNGRVGDDFSATVVRSVRSNDGQVVIPAGAEVYGTVTGLDDSDQIGDQAAVRLDFDAIAFGNDTYDLDAEVVDAGVETRRADADPTEEAAVGAAAGAALGAIVEGDLLGALIGGALGAGTGTVISLGTGDVEATLPAGTSMTLRTENYIDV